MKKVKMKMKILIAKLNVMVCAAGTYFMAFLAADLIERDLPLDNISAVVMIICNLLMIHLFVESGFELHKILENKETLKEPNKTSCKSTIIAEGFSEDFYKKYFEND